MPKPMIKSTDDDIREQIDFICDEMPNAADEIIIREVVNRLWDVSGPDVRRVMSEDATRIINSLAKR